MSNYARTVERLQGFSLGAAAELPVGTQIKNVKVTKSGYKCEANYRAPYAASAVWVPFVTDMDLPAVTDRGRESRAKHPRTTMRPGRPTKGDAPLTTTTGVRMRQDQLAALDAGCRKADVTRNEVIVGALVAQGLVPQ